MNKLQVYFLACTSLLAATAHSQAEASAKVRKISGYKGIWFDLGQKSEYGSKYSGGLGTYTAKHRPLAVYSPEAQKTFFVYGGTTGAEARHLLAMASYYDHKTNKVPKPVVVHDKKGVDDPHDNPSIQIDQDGYLYVFVSGRGKKRPGYTYRSTKPYDIHSFELLSKGEFTYPQAWWLKNQGFLFLFTKYTKGRELYWRMSDQEGSKWSSDRKLAAMGGHYQVSNVKGKKVITAFNYHPGGVVDKRTNLYFLQTEDRGKTWKNAAGEVLKTPLKDPNGKALVKNYRQEKKLVYMKDIGFDDQGNPVILYLTSIGHEPGPDNSPREWTIAHWNGDKWLFRHVAHSTHNYDMGSLYIEENGIWRVIAPTATGPQEHGTGGEICIWQSSDKGKSWKKSQHVTAKSKTNHSYVRRPKNCHDDFYAFWADGNPDKMSRSHLYFTNKSGTQVWTLPYQMQKDFESPLKSLSNSTTSPHKDRRIPATKN